jgi:GWxTD domain-containing protein
VNATAQEKKTSSTSGRETIAKPLTEKQKRKQEEKLRKELETPYRKWLNEDVAYIITDEERAAFKRLQTDEEREQFIEQFWLRRDPTPDSAENEFKEEHYRRIAYANERFASGIPGWKSDRGRIYITFGPADEIESHPSGGSYERPYEEGGGTTSTYPFEIWRYRYIDGIGTDILIEFVDPTMTGEYRMTMDPSEKDALLYVPNAGLTLMEPLSVPGPVCLIEGDRLDSLDTVAALVARYSDHDGRPVAIKALSVRGALMIEAIPAEQESIDAFRIGGETALVMLAGGL